MMKPRTFISATLSLAFLTTLPGQTDAEIRGLVYDLIDPELCPITKEKLLRLGRKAVPHLLEAILEKDMSCSRGAWSGTNRIPALAKLQATQIQHQGVMAALHVMQELGKEGEAAIAPLLDKIAPWDRMLGRDYRGVMTETVTRLAIHCGKEGDLALRRSFSRDPRLSFDEIPTTAELLANIEKFTEGGRNEGARYLAACFRLELQWRNLAREIEHRKQAIKLLEVIIQMHDPSPNIWPTNGGGRGMFTYMQDYWDTAIHDHGSLLLARIAPQHPLSIRGHMILLVDLRAAVRTQAALHLGQFGSKAAFATHGLIARLRDTIPTVRQIAITGLGLIGPKAKAAIPHLRTLSLGKDRRMAAAANAALKHIDLNPSDTWTYYHFNGKKEAEGRCLNGLKVGPWTHWARNGQKQWEGEYVAGQMHGTWTEWTAKGEVTHHYEHGRYLPAAK